MSLDLETGEFRYTGKGKLKLDGRSTKLKKRLYESKEDLEEKLDRYRKEIDELQQRMYAHDRYAMLLIFQAMDAAGKDGTIRHVMSGINPHGVEVHAFKSPSAEELEHDYLWRTTRLLPARGKIGIFNRSYYEEVLVVRVHPEILTGSQKLPKELVSDPDKVWDWRYEQIRNLESHLVRNGTRVVKFFLHVSKDEQKKRFLERIDEPAKNWKFNAGDVKERARWDHYMEAYSDALEETADKHSPWYVIPADDKGDMRLLVSAAILHEMRSLKLEWPELDAAQLEELKSCRAALMAE